MKFQLSAVLILLAFMVACNAPVTDKHAAPLEEPAEEASKQEIKTKHNSEGIVQHYLVLDYNENGQKIRVKEFNQDSVSLWYWEYEYEHDQVSKVVVYHGEDEVSMWADISNTPTGIYYTYEYKKSQLSKITQLTEAGTVLTYSIREYSDGQLSKETWHSASGTPTFYCSYESDEADQFLKGNVFDYNHKLVFYETYEYTDDKITKINRHSKAGNITGYDVIREI
ncbi:MAG: hypothetical protein JKY52_03925 [Flavobacteriales bacterium]|nr:hypothetical protein [Flavobacteriales bacterium]